MLIPASEISVIKEKPATSIIGPAAQTPQAAYFHRKYQNPDASPEDIPAGRASTYWTDRLSRQVSLRSSEEIDWRETGPTNVGGRTRAIASDYQNSAHVIAGGARGGIWTTQNTGDSWQHIPGETGNESITWITQHPNKPENWFATTGEYVGTGANFFGGNLLHSEDNGNSWAASYYHLEEVDSLNDVVYVEGIAPPLSSTDYVLGREGNPFQYASKILVNPISNYTYVATHGWGILRSQDNIRSFEHSLPATPARIERQLLPEDEDTQLLLRFEETLQGEQGEMPLNSPEVTYEEGIFGKGLALDSFDILDYSDSGNILGKEGTLEMWVQPNWDGNGGHENVFMEFGVFPYILYIHRVEDYMELLYATGEGNEWYSAGSSATDLRAGNWYHLAFSWEENNSINVFINGALVGSRSIDSLPEISTNYLRFGNPYGAGIDGVIDEVRISQRVRTPEEINTTYQYGLPEAELQALFPSYRAEYSDISINQKGELLGFLSGNKSSGGGVFLSKDDGQSWQNITPESWPEETARGLMAFAPSNPNVAYGFVLDNMGGDHLYYFDLETGLTEDRSANLPTWSLSSDPIDDGGGLITGGYYFVLSVKPDDENFVVLGGIGLGRSFDGFATKADTAYIHNILGIAHVDQHVLAYDPSNPDRAWLGNDGGLYYSEAIDRISQETTPYNRNYDNVQWQDKNRGYNVTQFYTVSQSADANDYRVTGGAQDNGFLTVKPNDPKLAHRAFGDDFGSDGSYVYMTPDFTYMSFQFGETYKLKTGPDGNPGFEVEWTQISPFGYDRDFIHAWAVDPNQENTMYYPIQDRMYRIDDIDQVLPYETYGQENFDLIADKASTGIDRITALSVAEVPEHTLFFAGQSPNGSVLKRVTGADTDSPMVEDVSVPALDQPWYYINCIEPHPENADEWLVIASNYDVPSIFRTTDGGSTYDLVEGNLSGDADIPGPSMEWAEILVYEGETYYFLATHLGVFMTKEFNGAATIWEHQGTETIGYALALMVRARPSDGKIVVATHGRGFFSGFLSEVVSGLTAKSFKKIETSIFPNPSQKNVVLQFSLPEKQALTIKLIGMDGRVYWEQEAKNYPEGAHQLSIDLTAVPAGIYVAQLQGGQYLGSHKFVKIKD